MLETPPSNAELSRPSLFEDHKIMYKRERSMATWAKKKMQQVRNKELETSRHNVNEVYFHFLQK